jgi:5-methylcytosine-specific restriction endonuclease McrA
VPHKVYAEKLFDPRWKKKCIKIRKRDNNQCTVCGAKKYLQVHHTFYYEDFPDPWLYPDESLLTVCRKCHREYHECHEIEIKKRPKTKFKNKKIKQKGNKKRDYITEIEKDHRLRIKKNQ